MSGDIDWHRDNEDRRGPGGGSGADPRRRRTKLDLLKGAWDAVRSVRFAGSSGGRRSHPAIAFVRRHLAVAVLVLLLVCPVAGLILGYMTRPAAGTAEQAASGISASPTDGGSGRIPKPPPGKPFLGTTQAPPPVVMHPPPAAAVEPQPPPAMAVAPRPLTPAPMAPNPVPNAPPPPPGAATGRPPYTPVVYTARHDKVFGEGCSGQLTLDSSGLAFQCGDDPSGSLRVALDDIEAVDGNGVRLISGKRYHFSIAGMGRSNAEQLFTNWLRQVR